MSLVTLPTTFVDNTIPTASQFNGDFQAITTVLNGGVDAANVDTTAIATVTGTQTLTNKTLSSPILYGNVSGWTASAATWTYASASTFTLVGDYTGIYRRGTRLFFTQTTAKYGVVISSSYSAPNTTVTIAVNSDYTIANAAITLPYYSYEASPQGYPGSFTFTPTMAGAGGSAGSYAVTTYCNQFMLTGNICTVIVYQIITNKGSWSGNVTTAMPIAANAFRSQYVYGIMSPTDNSVIQGGCYGPFNLANDIIGSWTKVIGGSIVQWSDLTANFTVIINGSYMIA